MKNPKDFHRKLQTEFAARQSRNPRYSLRKFASDAGVTQAYLSLLFNGHRRLTLERYLAICEKLGLPPENEVAARAVSRKRTAPLPVGGYDSSEFKKVSVTDEFRFRWFDLMIGDLLLLPQAKPDVKWISRQLRLSVQDVTESVERLERLGILRIEGDSLNRTNRKLHLDTRKSLDFMREYHRQMIRLASEELQKTDQRSFENRYISGASFTASKKAVAEMRKKSERFIQELIDGYATEAPSKGQKLDSLYQINLQLFPLASID